MSETLRDRVAKERLFYDRLWQVTEVRRIHGTFSLPCVDTVKGKKVLICSCGSGVAPVLAADAGAEVFAFDISETAARKAREMADFNGVRVDVEVMDFHDLKYQDAFFDVIYGDGILHHVDCSIAGRHILRCLKPGGVAYFRENSDRNPLLRFLRRVMFGRPGAFQRQSFLLFRRMGTTDEYPLTEKQVACLSNIFGGHLRRHYPEFRFFYLLYSFGWRNERLRDLLRSIDTVVSTICPFVRCWSFRQDIELRKPLA